MKRSSKIPNRKASANMWWIIIGAVIALVVMIVLLFMFTDKSGDVGRGITDCVSKGGSCDYDEGDCKVAEGTPTKAFTCDDNTICCFGAKNTGEN